MKIQVVIGLILFSLIILLNLGGVHLFDWDEANFAELAREMIASNNYLQPQINFSPFYEKPPLFIWMQVLSMKLFGINEFAARFPNYICALVALSSLYLIGKKHFDRSFAIFWVLSFGFSLAPLFYFKTGLIDPWFNLFMFLSIYFFMFLFQESPLKSLVLNSFLSALFLAAAIMTKGPVAIIIVGTTLAISWIVLKFKSFKNLVFVIPWSLVVIGLSSLWFLYITQKYGSTYVNEFIQYQVRLFQTEDAKHGGTILFHPVALFLGCFPASIFMFSGFSKSNFNSSFQNTMFKTMIVLGIVVLAVFSIVKTKIIHYSSMDYYPITFLAALGLYYIHKKTKSFPKTSWIVLFLIGFIWMFALMITPYLAIHPNLILPFIHDQNFLDQLQTKINWNIYTSLFGVLFGAIFFYGWYNLYRKFIKGIIAIFISIIVLIQILSFYYLPKIEKIVQGELVKFAESLQGKDVNTQALYVKSYNQFFYSKRSYFKNIEGDGKHLHYLYGILDRDCYFILRQVDKIRLDTAMGPKTKFLYEKNGYAFFERLK